MTEKLVLRKKALLIVSLGLGLTATMAANAVANNTPIVGVDPAQATQPIQDPLGPDCIQIQGQIYCFTNSFASVGSDEYRRPR